MTEKQVNYINEHRTSVARQATRTAAECAGFLIPTLETLRPDFLFLDLGCGPGSITLDLAQRFPQATFLGIDGAKAPIAQARELQKARGIINATFKVGDILQLTDDDLAWGTFDAVYCHQVLLHMQRPVDALRVMQRAAKPDGGLVAARESFTSGQLFRPDDSGLLRRLGTTMAELLRRNGSDPEVGAKLLEKVAEAGWRRDQVKASFSSWSLTTVEEKSNFVTTLSKMLNDPDSGARKRAFEAGLLDDQSLKETVQALQDWLDNDVSWGNYVNGEIICANGSWPSLNRPS